MPSRRTAVLLAVVALLMLGGARAEEEDEHGFGAFTERIEALSSRVRRGVEPGISFGTLATLRAFVEDMARFPKRDRNYVELMQGVVGQALDKAEQGEDVIAAKRGMFWRGYRSRYSHIGQLYSIYVPENYDPEVPMPLVVTLHGGSSNHNVWLSINLGNKISVDDYWHNHRVPHEAVQHPEDAIVVAPDGLGQIRWRWMGEQDIFDVIDDVRRNYSIDADKIFLTGLSNGGIGAYTAGLKQAWRFAAVFPLSGVTDWARHNVSNLTLRRSEKIVLDNESAITYAGNAFNTHFRFYHGARDSGFKVEQAQRLAAKLERLGAPFRYHEFKMMGHDLGHVMWRKMLIMKFVKRYTRLTSPAEVRLTTASERAGRQFWVVLDDRVDHTRPAEIRAVAVQRTVLEVETRNARRLTLLLDQAPVFSPIEVKVDGQAMYSGPIPPSNRLTFERLPAGDPAGACEPEAEAADAGAEKAPMWRRWDGRSVRPGSRKTALLSGPIGDANYEEQVHVYGTQVADDIFQLKKAALLGARGWMPARQYTEVRHPVIRDTELTQKMMQDKAVVLYGNARNNSVLAELGDRLPIQVGKRHIKLRDEKFTGGRVGARFVCPNPLAPHRYLVVQAGVTANAVEEGAQLPIYLADYIVYNAQTTRKKAFMVLGSLKEVETGFFTEEWRLPERSRWR